MTKVLISGASVAGPVLASWLRRAGVEVTVVERADTIRGGGYPIDLRGVAVDVVERMGLLEAVEAARTGTRRLTFVSERGTTIGAPDPATLQGEQTIRAVELPRGDLTALLWAATRDDVDRCATPRRRGPPGRCPPVRTDLADARHRLPVRSPARPRHERTREVSALRSIPITAELLAGALELETTATGVLPHRLPARARALADPQLLTAEACPAGVRLAFRTAATVIEVDAVRTTMAFRDTAPRPDGRYDLLVDGALTDQRPSSGGRTVVIDLATGAAETHDGPLGTVRFADLPARDKHVEIWLPHHERTELVDLRADATVTPAPPRGRPVWVHHGSSISQGSNAASPTTTWPALAAAAGRVDLVNLGFSGSMMLDPFVARTIRDLPADLLSLEIGINIVGGDVMRRRAFAPAVHGFLDTVRDGHPTTPLLVVSPLLCGIHEDTPGPGAPDFSDGTVRFRAVGDPAEVTDSPVGKLSLRAVRAELARVVAQRSPDDPHLHMLDGLTLYGEADAAEHPLPDRLHPDAATHRIVGERFAAHAFSGPFAARD